MKEVDMKENDFDKRVKEMMELHEEVPQAVVWDSLSSALDLRHRRRVLLYRRLYYYAAAVAAVLFLLLMPLSSLFDDSDKVRVIPVDGRYDPISSLRPEYSIVNKGVAAHPIGIRRGFELQELYDLRSGLNPQPESGTDPQIKLKSEHEHEYKFQSDNKSDPESELEIEFKNESKSDSESKRTPGSKILPDYYNKRRQAAGPSIALSANLSPSLSGNSVSLMTMSQIQGGYASSDVVSTVQKANVPRETVTNTKFLMPLTFGVQLRMPLGDKLSAGTGVNYTLLFSHYDAISREEARETQQTLHYIGFPVGLYYTVFKKENLTFYLNAGAMLEKGLYAWYVVSENGERDSYGRSVDGVQWSVNGGAGVEMAMGNSSGIYFDPSFAYFFDNSQPLSIRTSQPLQFRFELGLRFHL
jgi:hypothetical protein